MEDIYNMDETGFQMGVTVEFENSFPSGHMSLVSRFVPETALSLVRLPVNSPCFTMSRSASVLYFSA